MLVNSHMAVCKVLNKYDVIVGTIVLDLSRLSTRMCSNSDMSDEWSAKILTCVSMRMC